MVEMLHPLGFFSWPVPIYTILPHNHYLLFTEEFMVELLPFPHLFHYQKYSKTSCVKVGLVICSWLLGLPLEQCYNQ